MDVFFCIWAPWILSMAHLFFDIKPYIAYADSEPEAKSSFAQEKPPAKLNVEFTEIAKVRLKNITKTDRT